MRKTSLSLRKFLFRQTRKIPNLNCKFSITERIFICINCINILCLFLLLSFFVFFFAPEIFATIASVKSRRELSTGRHICIRFFSMRIKCQASRRVPSKVYHPSSISISTTIAFSVQHRMLSRIQTNCRVCKYTL